MSANEIGGYIGGVCVALLSTSTNATGLFLQKSVHKRREGLPKGQGKPFYREWRWMLGLGCLFAGSLLSLAVFALLGQSRASAMAALTIAVNAILASWFLGEKFTYIDLATTLCIATGTVISVVFGSAAGGPDIHYNVETIVQLLHRTIVYEAAPTMVGIYVLLAAYIWFANRRTKQGKSSHFILKFECFARAFCAGIFSGTTGFATKATVVCITNMWNSHDYSDLKRFEFYFFVLALPCSLVCQLYYLNTGLKRFDSMEMIPPYQSSIVTIGVAFGWIFFNEAEGVPASSMVMFAVGCAISIVGISLLFLKPRAPKPGGTTSTEPLLNGATLETTSATAEALTSALDKNVMNGYEKLADDTARESMPLLTKGGSGSSASMRYGAAGDVGSAARTPTSNGDHVVDSPAVHISRMDNPAAAMLDVIEVVGPTVAQAVKTAAEEIRHGGEQVVMRAAAAVRRSRGDSYLGNQTIAFRTSGDTLTSQTQSTPAAAAKGGKDEWV